MSDIDAAGPVPHPAKFSGAVLDVIATALRAYLPTGRTVLDPFAGVGLIHRLHRWQTYAIELEPEWAEQSAQLGPTWCGDFFDFHPHDALALDPRAMWPGQFDAVVTSCTYANRMADSHTPSPADTSKRITYRHQLGRPLTDNNSGAMQWGAQYRFFHKIAWRKVRRLLRPGGLFVLNVSDHIRKGEQIPVVDWHANTIIRLGFELVRDIPVPTPRMGFGANGQTRVDHEHVMVFRLQSSE